MHALLTVKVLTKCSDKRQKPINTRTRFTIGTFAAVGSGRIFANGVPRAVCCADSTLVDVLTFAVHHSVSLRATDLKGSDLIDADLRRDHRHVQAFVDV